MDSSAGFDLLLEIVAFWLVVAALVWLVRALRESRRYGTKAIGRIQAEIAHWEPYWLEQDRLKAQQLRATISKAQVDHAHAAYISALKSELERAENLDSAKYDYFRDNIRLGLRWDLSRFGHHITPKEIDRARLLTGPDRG